MQRVVAYALIAVGRVLTAVQSAEEVLKSRKFVVTAERVPMAVILIVEDEVFTREITELVIQEWGHQTLSASDVEEALLILRAPQHIDVLFTDIYLKKAVLGGCDLAREAIKLRPQLRVLYTTGNVITEAMKALFVEGTHCLCKPYADYQLQAQIERMLEG